MNRTAVGHRWINALGLGLGGPHGGTPSSASSGTQTGTQSGTKTGTLSGAQLGIPLRSALRSTLRAARRWVPRLVAPLVLATLTACGTPYATAPAASSGRPVMLLGHDPVAYFTRGQPMRGEPTLSVDLPERTYYFASAEHRALFLSAPERYEPQYGGFCASGAAFAVKLGSDPTSWVIRDGRLFIFGDILGQVAWGVDPKWNVDHADRLWPAIKNQGWRSASLAAYLNKVPHYLTGAQIKAQWEAQNPGKVHPTYDPGGMVNNLFLKHPGWRAAEGFGQPALGYPR